VAKTVVVWGCPKFTR